MRYYFGIEASRGYSYGAVVNYTVDNGFTTVDTFDITRSRHLKKLLKFN